MRRAVFALLPLALVAIGMTAPAEEPAEEPAFEVRVVNIVAACTPGTNPAVQPPLIQMNRIDNISWRLASGQASGAAVPEMKRIEAEDGVRYSYNVSISCPDGSSQLIDPDIVIGGAQ